MCDQGPKEPWDPSQWSHEELKEKHAELGELIDQHLGAVDNLARQKLLQDNPAIVSQLMDHDIGCTDDTRFACSYCQLLDLLAKPEHNVKVSLTPVFEVAPVVRPPQHELSDEDIITRMQAHLVPDGRQLECED